MPLPVFDPLQSSQGAEGPRMPPHYSEAPICIPQFDLAKVGMFPKMLPVTDQENALLKPHPRISCYARRPLQDWAEVKVGQGVAHAQAAPCR